MKLLWLFFLLNFAWAAPIVSVEAWVANQPKSGVGTLVVQMEIPEGLDIQWPEPEVAGLRFTETGEPQTETFGTTSVVRRSFRFSGQPGHYEIPSLTVKWKVDDTVEEASSNSIFVDLEKDPMRAGELSDIAEPEKVWRLPAWIKWVFGVGLVGVLALVSAAVLLRRRDVTEPEEVKEAPDVVAIRTWEAVRENSGLTDYEKSVEISRIFRIYAEAALGFTATAWTTREILDRLGGMQHLKEGNVPRAKRLLRATDRIKFADAAAAEELFDDLDADLRGFVGSTRPTTWGEST